MQSEINFILVDEKTSLDHINSLREEKNSRECRQRQEELTSGKSGYSKLQIKLITHTLTEEA
tara:strand:- start:1729 stop:1914 length:186 start_codon:yes stop_codon:yes gene_type:complete